MASIEIEILMVALAKLPTRDEAETEADVEALIFVDAVALAFAETFMFDICVIFNKIQNGEIVRRR